MEKLELKRKVILALMAREQYGYSIAKALISRGNKVHLGYLYETLGQMEAEGMVKSRWVKGSIGPKRKMYSIAGEGRKSLGGLLRESLETVIQFYSAYLDSLPPERSVVEAIRQAVNNIFPLKDARVLVFVVASSFDPVMESGLRSLRTDYANLTIYLVKPRRLDVSFELPNLVVLNGDADDIPLKDKIADIVYLENLFATNLPSCVRELKRVTRPGGVVAFGAPQLQLTQGQDPLDIGEYMMRELTRLPGATGMVDRASIEDEISKQFKSTRLSKAGPFSWFISRA